MGLCCNVCVPPDGPDLTPVTYEDDTDHALRWSGDCTLDKDSTLKPEVEWNPLRLTIVSARHLRNADIGLPWSSNVSDPYCICEIQGKPLSRTVTEVIKNNLDPVWNQHAAFADFKVGDTLLFTVWDKDTFKSDDLLGRASLSSEQFHPSGFDDELLLSDAGFEKRKKRKAFLKIKIEEATPKGPPTGSFGSQTSEDSSKRPSEPASPSGTANLSSRWASHRSSSVRKAPTGNGNHPSDYVWLEGALDELGGNKAGALKCVDLESGKAMTPVLFVLGGCPNAFCGMQAVMFCADVKLCIDFWWVKPKKDVHTELEKNTLNRNITGKHKNDPGRSKPFYQPIADLFQNSSLAGGWRFGVENVETPSGSQGVRVFIHKENLADERLYMLLFWQEDWTTNPLARHKYVRGKLVYQKDLYAAEYFSRQYEIQDGVARIADTEEEPVSTSLPKDDIKDLWDM